MPRGVPRKPRASKKNAVPDNIVAAELIKALSFLSVVPNKKDNPNSVIINGPMITTSNGIIKAGTVMAQGFPADVVAKVDIDQLAGALARVSTDLTVAFNDDVVTFEAADFNAVLINQEINPNGDRMHPDANVAPLNNDFRTAVASVMRIVSDTADVLDEAVVAVTGVTVMASKRHTVLEAWHGNNLPPFGWLFLPKSFCTALSKITTDIVGCGLNGTGVETNSFTVHFADGSFLQTNTYQNAWQLEGKPFDFMYTTAQQMLTDTQINEPVFDKLDLLAKDTRSIAEIIGDDDIHYKLGELIAVNGRARIEARYAAGAPFVYSPAWFLAIADLFTAAKVDTISDPARMLLWSADGRCRGVMLVDKEPPPVVNTAAGWSAPANPTPEPEPPATPWGNAAASAGPAWGTPAGAGTFPSSAPASSPVSSGKKSSTGPSAPPPASPSDGVPAFPPPAGWGAPPAAPAGAPPAFPPSQNGWGGDDDE